MTIRIDYPFEAQFEFNDPGTSSLELRTQALHLYLLDCGMELSHPIDEVRVASFSGEDNGEFWTVKLGR